MCSSNAFKFRCRWFGTCSLFTSTLKQNSAIPLQELSRALVPPRRPLGASAPVGVHVEGLPGRPGRRTEGSGYCFPLLVFYVVMACALVYIMCYVCILSVLKRDLATGIA